MSHKRQMWGERRVILPSAMSARRLCLRPAICACAKQSWGSAPVAAAGGLSGMGCKVSSAADHGLLDGTRWHQAVSQHSEFARFLTYHSHEPEHSQIPGTGPPQDGQH